MRHPWRILGALLLSMASACRAANGPPGPPSPEPDVSAPARSGEEIVVCGRRFFVGTRVVLWSEPPGYDASAPNCRFGPDPADKPQERRYQPGRKERGEAGRVLVEPGSEDLDRLREVVDQFVLHYDAAGTSRECFRILQDVRRLSVHFLLDVDGTIYQTLDLRDQAWHATKANPRSIGVEIANLGVQGPNLEQPAFTEPQYLSLARLAAALCVVFPRIATEIPREGAGAVRTNVLSDPEFEAFRGILGHLHVQAEKLDPGPAFDWERFLADVRGILAEP